MEAGFGWRVNQEREVNSISSCRDCTLLTGWLSTGMTILVADDNSFSRELMRELLEESGHVIIEAVNGCNALDLIERNQPDLVFLDLEMPLKGGFSVIRELRADARFHGLAVVA